MKQRVRAPLAVLNPQSQRQLHGLTSHRRALLGPLVLLGALTLLGCKKERKESQAAAAVATASAAVSAKPAVTAVEEARRVTPSAAAHLPPGCQIALRVDAQKLFENAVLGPQLLLAFGDESKLPEGVTVPPKNASQEAFLKMLDELELKPRRDLREVAACINPSQQGTHFLVVIGGDLPRGVTDAMKKHAPPELQYKSLKLGEREAIERDGKWLAQSADHTLVFGDDAELLKGALVARETPQYSLSGEHDLSVALAEGSLPDQTGAGPLGETLERFKQAELGFDLKAGKVEAKFVFPSEADAKAVVAGVQKGVEDMKRQLRAAPPEVRASAQPWVDGLSAMKSEIDGTRLRIEIGLPPGYVESSLQQMLMMSMMGGVPPGAMSGGMAPPQMARPGPRPGAPTGARPPRPKGPRRVPALPPLPDLQLTPPLAGGPAPAAPPLRPKASE